MNASVDPVVTQPIHTVPHFEDALFKQLSTAVVKNLAPQETLESKDLQSVRSMPAMRALLSAIRDLAHSEGCSEKESAEQMVQAFRQLDRVWSQAIFQNGVQQILGSRSESRP